MANRNGGFINQDGLNAPDEPTNVAGTAGDEQVSVSFTAPSDVGGAAITGYRVTSNDGIGASGSSSPITVTGLTNGSSYTFRVWAINSFGWSSPSGATGSITPVAPVFALFGGGVGSPANGSIERFDINTTGNGVDFGDFITARYYLAACGNATRSIFAGGDTGSQVNIIDYISPTGAGGYASDFGDLSGTMSEHASCSNSTRGLFGGGAYNGSGLSNRVDYITIATTGNSSDYGDLSVGRNEPAALASTTRAVFAGGSSGNVIDYRTISTTGNFSDFGDLTVARNGVGASNNTRGLFAGGDVSANVIDYITIATTGNATDFGDLTEPKSAKAGATSNPTRAVIAGGFNGSVTSKVIDYVTIATTGNASVFGNLDVARRYTSATSTGHGGLA